jgi:hypothetical protein
MADKEHMERRVDKAAEEMETELRKLEGHAGEVDSRIDETRKEWEAKRRDPSVPGAEPPDEEDAGGEIAGDWEGEGPAADEGGQ